MARDSAFPDKLVRLLSTFFYVGLFPLAPGSLASLVGVFLCVLLHQDVMAYVTVLAAVTAVGFLVSGRMEVLAGEKDPSCVVIDEVAGVMLAFFLLPLTPSVAFTAFFVFRAFDMFKIYPANKLEAIHGGTGIMMDDIIAGFYTNVVMHIAVRWAGII